MPSVRVVVMVTLEALFYIISVVEQKPHHHFILEAVLQGSGKQCVTHYCKVTVHVCFGCQEQLHDVMAARPNCHQEATQWIQICLCTRSQQDSGALDISIGDSKVEGGPPHVSVGFRLPGIHSIVDIEAVSKQELQAAPVASFCCGVNWTLTRLLDGLLGGQRYKHLHSSAWQQIKVVSVIRRLSHPSIQNLLVVSSIRSLMDGQVSSGIGQIGVSSVVQQQLDTGGVSWSSGIQQDTLPVTGLRVDSATWAGTKEMGHLWQSAPAIRQVYFHQTHHSSAEPLRCGRGRIQPPRREASRPLHLCGSLGLHSSAVASGCLCCPIWRLHASPSSSSSRPAPPRHRRWSAGASFRKSPPSLLPGRTHQRVLLRRNDRSSKMESFRESLVLLSLSFSMISGFNWEEMLELRRNCCDWWTL